MYYKTTLIRHYLNYWNYSSQSKYQLFSMCLIWLVPYSMYIQIWDFKINVHSRRVFICWLTHTNHWWRKDILIQNVTFHRHKTYPGFLPCPFIPAVEVCFPCTETRIHRQLQIYEKKEEKCSYSKIKLY